MRAWKITDEISTLQEVRQNIIDKLTSTTANYSGEVVQSSKDPHKFDAFVELDNHIDNRLRQLCKVQTEIMDAISKVESPVYRNILLMRYIENREWHEIEDRIGYEHSYTTRLHGAALAEISKVCQNHVKS